MSAPTIGMMSAAAALHKAVLWVLAGDGPLRRLAGPGGISDRPAPKGTAGAHVLVGAITSADWSTSTESGEEHRLVVEVSGGVALLAVVARVQSVLTGSAMNLPGHVLVNFEHRETRARREKADMVFRAVTEPTTEY